jgi:cell division protein FtsB
MPFKIECPHCKKILNVTENAYGKVLPCPACNQPMTVPAAADCDANPPIMPPPIPDDAEPGNVPSQSEQRVDVLAGYRRRSKPAGAQIKERLKHGVDVIRKRGAAMKLQHEVNSLQTAIDGQFEILGTLAMTHRPSAVDIGAEIAELSRIQNELARKETTIESLRQTKGGGSAVKQLKREASQLRNGQQAVMIAIGKKASAAKAEMPGAVGAYAALDRLQSSLEAKQGELKAIEDEIGPLWNAEGAGFRALKRPLIVIGAIAGGLVLLYLLWNLLAATMFAAGLPTWVRYYVPNDTQAIVYFNVDKFRKTQVFEKLEGLLPSRSEMKRFFAWYVCPDEVRDVFFLVQEDGCPIVVLRTYEDLPLAKIVSNRERDSEPQKYKGFEYIRSDNGYCAKTATCTYCIAPSEDSIERTLKRLDRKESPRLDKDLQSAVESVAGNDYYAAIASSALTGEHSNLPGMPRRLRRIVERVNYAAAYLSFSSSVRFQYLLAFDKQSDAEDCKEALESDNENLDKLEDALERLPPQMRTVVAKVAKRCREATTITRKGCLVHSRTDLKMADVEDVIDQISAFYRGAINNAMKPAAVARPARKAMPRVLEP